MTVDGAHSIAEVNETLSEYTPPIITNPSYPLKALHLLIGKRGLGKTHTAIYDIYKQNMDKYDEVFITTHHYLLGSYSKITNKVYTMEYNEAIYEEVLKNPHKRYFVFFDDTHCGTKNSKQLADILPYFDNCNSTIVVSIQYCMELNTNIRNRFDFTHIFNDDLTSNRHKLYDIYTSAHFTTSTKFKNVLNNMKKYDVLLLDKTNILSNDHKIYIKTDVKESKLRLIESGNELSLDKKYGDEKLDSILKRINEAIDIFINARNDLKKLMKVKSEGRVVTYDTKEKEMIKQY